MFSIRLEAFRLIRVNFFPIILALIFLMGLFSLPIKAQAYYSLGKPTGFVNDYTNTLSSIEKSVLEDKLKAFEASTTNEIAVAIIASLEGDSRENFALKLFEEWKIGKDGKDNGILLLIAMNDREFKIETGYGMEPYVTDAIASQIFRKDIIPNFQSGKYYEGLYVALDNIIKAASNAYEYVDDENTVTSKVSGIIKSISSGGFQEIFGIFFYLIFMFAITGIAHLLNYLAKSKTWWQGGVIGAFGGILIWVLTGMAWGTITTIVLILLGLLIDFLISKHGPIKGWSGKGIIWFGGGGRGGLGGGGGFGGFGGGSSGGGGAGGRW
jgi:uncharacterized protein